MFDTPFGRLKIVILDCPYDTWGSPLTADLFHKIIQLKFQGYQREYPYGVLPVDTSDFIGTHHALCIERNGSLEPIMAYRTISNNRCKIHRMGLPALSLMKMLGHKKHEEAMTRILEDCERRKADVTYASSLTVRSDMKGSTEIRNILKAIHVLYHQDYHIPEIIGGGVLRFKVDAFYKFWGYDPLTHEAEILPPIPVPFVFNEITGFYHLRHFSAESIQFAEEYRALWESRLTIDRSTNNLTEKLAA